MYLSSLDLTHPKKCIWRRFRERYNRSYKHVVVVVKYRVVSTRGLLNVSDASLWILVRNYLYGVCWCCCFFFLNQTTTLASNRNCPMYSAKEVLFIENRRGDDSFGLRVWRLLSSEFNVLFVFNIRIGGFGRLSVNYKLHTSSVRNKRTRVAFQVEINVIFATVQNRRVRVTNGFSE